MPAYHHTPAGPQPCHILETHIVHDGLQVDIATSPDDPPYALRVPVSTQPTPGHVTITAAEPEPEPQPQQEAKPEPSSGKPKRK